MIKIKKIIKKILLPIFYLTANREKALHKEEIFWEKWIKTKGLDRPEDYKLRVDSNSEMTGYHKQIVDYIKASKVKILDVGSGPLTAIGKKTPNKEIDIIAVDPLADTYNKILNKYEIKPAIKTEKCEGEKLVERFGIDAFDWVNAQNSVDHSYNPMEVLKQIITVTKPCGMVSLMHRENEAKKESYRQLHQWNFSLNNGDLMLSGRTNKKINISKEFNNLIEFILWKDEDWIIAIGKKVSDNSNQQSSPALARAFGH